MREVREREGVELRNNHLTGSGHFLLAHLLADAGQLRHLVEAVLGLVEVLAGVFELGQQVGVVLLVDDEVGDDGLHLEGGGGGDGAAADVN